MSFAVQIVGYGLLVPAAVSATLLGLSRGLLHAPAARRYEAAVAVVSGFVVACLLWPWLPAWPTNHWHWLPQLALLAAVWGPVAQAAGVARWERLLLYAVLAALAASLLVPTWDQLGEHRFGYRILVATAVLVGSSLLEPSLRRQGSVFSLTMLLLVFAGGALLLAQSGSLKFAQLAGAAAAALAGCGLVAAVRPGRLDLAPLAAAVSVLLSGLLFAAYVNSFSEVPWWCYVLLGAAPLGAGVGEIGPLAGRSVWFRRLLAGAAVLLPLLVALAAALASELPG